MQTAEANQELQLREQLTTIQLQDAIIKDQVSYDRVAGALVSIKTWRSNWKRYWYGDGETGPIPMANRAWKGLLDKFNGPDKEAATAEGIAKSKLLAWDQAQAEIQRKAQEEADRAARAKEEAERAAKAAEMEVFEVSDSDIEEYLAAPSVAVAEVVQPTYQKAAGISTRANWVCKVTDLKALLKAIGAGKFKLSADDTAKTVEFFESLLKKQATANQTTLNIPGCQAVNQPVIGARGR